MWLEVSCEFELTVSVPSPLILLLRPRSGPHQWLASDRYALTPFVPATEYTDAFGNLCQRLIAPVGGFSVRTEAIVHTASRPAEAPGAPYTLVQALPDDVLVYLMPSRFCESDRFGPLAAEVVAGERPGYDQVAAIVRWIRARIGYLADTDPEPIAALAVSERRAGVCRDFGHLGIALCRALNIPARFVVGYLEGLVPMDMHAWFEAFIDGRWYTFDATQHNLNGARVVVAYGRDAADVPMFNLFGPPAVPSRMEVDVTVREGPPAC